MSYTTVKKHIKGEYSVVVWVGYELNPHGAVVFKIENDGQNHWTLSNQTGFDLLDATTKAELVSYLKTRNREKIVELDKTTKNFYQS
jgi:hypothetical protein